jgi:hypothetical protein
MDIGRRGTALKLAREVLDLRQRLAPPSHCPPTYRVLIRGRYKGYVSVYVR